MNRKQLTLLFVVLIVVGGAGLLLQKNNNQVGSAGEQGAGQKVLGDKFPVNDIALVTIKHETNELNLVKKDDTWRVRERSDYPANFSQLGEALIKLSELKIVQIEDVGASQLGRMELAAPGAGTNSGTVVDLKDKDGKVLKSLTLGKRHLRKSAQPSPFGDEGGFPDGRYVMVSGQANKALLVGEALNTLDPKPEQWLRKDFFKVERPKAISVTFAEATNSWKLNRDTESGEWKLADLKPTEKQDATKVSGVTTPFASPSFNDIGLATSKPEEFGLDKPTVVTVETFDDFTYTVNIGRKTGEDYPITMSVAANFPKERSPGKDEKPEDKDKADKAFKDRQKQLEDKLKEAKAFEKWTYLLPAWNADPVLKNRKDLLEEKKDETKTPVDAPAAPVIPTLPGGK